MKKSFLILILLLLTFIFVSCKEEENKDNVSVENQEGNAFMGDEDIFAERAKVDDELPEKDYGGRDFRVVGHSRGEFYIDPENTNQGNLIVDAKAKRNVLVEERFNINIVPTFSGTYMEVNDWVSKSILSGVDEFDLLVNHVVDSGAMVLKNLFLNWYDIPHVDFTKPWWAASTSTDLTYDGKCILAISDFNNSAITCTYIMVFNKNLANAYDLGNIYDVVFDGNWTYDYFYELVKDIYTDLDGSTDRTEGDFYGMAQGHYSLGPYLYSFDNPIV
ncbi:MAG: hypothetical protein IIV81_00755, partial [Clostridia bacterium]|nr:hypothetical protein [Clostridia bacterium]